MIARPVEHGPNETRDEFTRLMGGYDVAITLDTHIEYSLILPAVIDHLQRKIAQKLNLGLYDDCEQLYIRWSQIEAFQQNLKAVPFDAARSFDLSPQETEAAIQYVDAAPGPNTMESQLTRQWMAACIGSCVGAEYLKLQSPQELQLSA